MAAANERQRRQQAELLAEAHRLYEQYGKPLEAEHLGEFVAIARNGRTQLGTSAGAVGRQAKQVFGPGNFVFKIGPRVVGRWR